MTVGWGTLAYGIVAGAMLGLGLVFLLNGARTRRPDPLMASLGAFSSGLGVVALVIVRLHASTSVSDYATWVQIFGLVSLVTIVALFTLVAVWTASISRVVMVVFGVATAVIAILQLTLENGLLVGEIEQLRPVSLFGEEFVVHEGSQSPWRPVLDVYLLAVFAVVVVAIVRGYRLGLRTHSILMAATLAVMIAFSYYDGLVDFGVVGTTYLIPFGALGIAIAGAMYLAERSLRSEMQLIEQATILEETVMERTAALIEANRRLEEQLTRQRASTRNLTSLAERFELSNSMVDPNPTAIERSIASLLEGLGMMVSAIEIELELDEDHIEGLLPRSMMWRRPHGHGRVASHADATAIAVGEDISIGERSVGHLRANIAGDRVGDTDAAQYIGLAAEHLAGLIHRLDLVAQVADSAVEDERQRIAMELHDSVTQRMYSISFLADAAAHAAMDGSEELTELVERIRELVLSSLAELRVLLLELRPNAFDEVELHLLLEQLADHLMSAYDAEIVVSAPTAPSIATDVKTALYRISQEAISNACRHGHPHRVMAELLQEGDEITLVIRDDGVGFDPATAGSGSGLENLKARASSIGAEFDITSEPEMGTSVVVRHRGAVASVATAATGGADR